MSYSGLSSVGIFGIKSTGMMSFVNNVTKNEDLYVDYCNSSEFSITGETVDALGAGSPYVSWDTPKEGSATLNLQISSMEMLSVANGSVLETLPQEFYHREVITLTKPNDTFLLARPNIIEGSIKYYKLNKDLVTKIDMGKSTFEAKKEDKKTRINSTNTSIGDIILITYTTKEEAETFVIKNLNEDMVNYTLYMRAKVKTKAEGKYADAQLVFPNVMVTAENNFNFDAEAPTDFVLSLRILADSNGDMVRWSLVPDAVTTPAPAPTTTTETTAP